VAADGSGRIYRTTMTNLVLVQTTNTATVKTINVLVQPMGMWLMIGICAALLIVFWSARNAFKSK
jgi:hypothetical protein